MQKEHFLKVAFKTPLEKILPAPLHRDFLLSHSRPYIAGIQCTQMVAYRTYYNFANTNAYIMCLFDTYRHNIIWKSTKLLHNAI